jgi:hypothetical protein
VSTGTNTELAAGFPLSEERRASEIGFALLKDFADR